MSSTVANRIRVGRRSEVYTLVYRTQGAEGSQPAMKTRRNEDVNKMCKIKDVNVRMNVMYDMCACYYRVL